ncbi:hypothetical protein PAAG_12278 [Paracoccidioides lutzii Pb01]|uniref:Uncharacterized protein n=1 Tax=Paracoccidioides lutzii (strain ATCC MYA-826 / Pb01) TaxID=502779 RepID=A0A0A2V3S2_PARBA|nr:hypothetical protein PAAG_12278 [Paracoccidioides lutzii Pb01]KGQ01027.1 hypothetical protein PAAG_12278 [Paracoccidioides lutzii Pb01]
MRQQVLVFAASFSASFSRRQFLVAVASGHIQPQCGPAGKHEKTRKRREEREETEAELSLRWVGSLFRQRATQYGTNTPELLLGWGPDPARSVPANRILRGMTRIH